MNPNAFNAKQKIYEDAAQKMASLSEKCNDDLSKIKVPLKAPKVFICLVIGILVCALVYVPIFIRTRDAWFLLCGLFRGLQLSLGLFLTGMAVRFIQIKRYQKAISQPLTVYIQEERRVRATVQEKIEQEESNT